MFVFTLIYQLNSRKIYIFPYTGTRDNHFGYCGRKQCINVWQQLNQLNDGEKWVYWQQDRFITLERGCFFGISEATEGIRMIDLCFIDRNFEYIYICTMICVDHTNSKTNAIELTASMLSRTVCM